MAIARWKIFQLFFANAGLDADGVMIGTPAASKIGSAAFDSPENAGPTTAHFSGGATNLTLEVPNGVAAQIRTRGGLNTLSVDQSRFPAAGADTYRSPDYATAANKVDITVETGVSTIRVS